MHRGAIRSFRHSGRRYKFFTMKHFNYELMSVFVRAFINVYSSVYNEVDLLKIIGLHQVMTVWGLKSMTSSC